MPSVTGWSLVVPAGFRNSVIKPFPTDLFFRDHAALDLYAGAPEGGGATIPRHQWRATSSHVFLRVSVSVGTASRRGCLSSVRLHRAVVFTDSPLVPDLSCILTGPESLPTGAVCLPPLFFAPLTSLQFCAKRSALVLYNALVEHKVLFEPSILSVQASCSRHTHRNRFQGHHHVLHRDAHIWWGSGRSSKQSVAMR